MDMIRDLNYTRLYYIALVIVPAGKGPIPHLTHLSPRACGRPRLRAARRARDALARLLYMARPEPDRTGTDRNRLNRNRTEPEPIGPTDIIRPTDRTEPEPIGPTDIIRPTDRTD